MIFLEDLAVFVVSRGADAFRLLTTAPDQQVRGVERAARCGAGGDDRVISSMNMIDAGSRAIA